MAGRTNGSRPDVSLRFHGHQPKNERPILVHHNVASQVSLLSGQTRVASQIPLLSGQTGASSLVNNPQVTTVNYPVGLPLTDDVPKHCCGRQGTVMGEQFYSGCPFKYNCQYCDNCCNKEAHLITEWEMACPGCVGCLRRSCPWCGGKECKEIVNMNTSYWEIVQPGTKGNTEARMATNGSGTIDPEKWDDIAYVR